MLHIPGFGARALEDVLKAVNTRGDGPEAGSASRYSAHHRYLDDELTELLSARRARRPQLSTPLLRRALTLIGSRLPGSESEVLRWLEASGLTRGTVDLGQLERAARFCETPSPFAVLRRDGLTLAVKPERLRLASMIYALAVRSVVSFGLALLRRIAFLARTEDLGFVRTVLTARSSFQWLDRRVGWFWFGNLNTQLVRTIDNILSVAGEVPFRELAHGLFRRSPPDNAPTRRTLRRLCAQIAGVEVRGNLVRLRRPEGAGPLPERERTLLRLFESCGPQIEGYRLPEICERMGLDAGPLGRQLRASPFVVERRPGVFRLIGS